MIFFTDLNILLKSAEIYQVILFATIINTNTNYLLIIVTCMTTRSKDSLSATQPLSCPDLTTTLPGGYLLYCSHLTSEKKMLRERLSILSDVTKLINPGNLIPIYASIFLWILRRKTFLPNQIDPSGGKLK